MKTIGFSTSVTSKKFLTLTFLISGTLSWIFITYFALEDVFRSITGNVTWAYAGKALFMSIGAIFALIGASLTQKINRRKILWIWITIGVLSTALLAVVQGTILGLLVSLLLGVSLGLGFPSCMSFLAESTLIEERARVAGAIILETFIIVSVSVLAYSILKVGVLGLILLSVGIRATSYIALSLDSCDKQTTLKEKTVSWRKVLERKDFALYLIPWLMFNICSGLIYLVWNGLSDDYSSILNIGSTLHYLVAGIFGFIAGLAADRSGHGRKQLIIVGMIILGVSFALLGVFPSTISVLVYLISSGIAWGFLIVVFTAVPGDLALPESKEKFYALGAVIPFAIYFAIIGVIDFLYLSVQASASVLSSTLSIILFLSVIPILKAEETLPESAIRHQKMKKHIEELEKTIKETK